MVRECFPSPIVLTRVLPVPPGPSPSAQSVSAPMAARSVHRRRDKRLQTEALSSAQPVSAPMAARSVHRRRDKRLQTQAMPTDSPSATSYPTVSMFPTRYFSHHPTGPTKPPSPTQRPTPSPTPFFAANKVESAQPTHRTRYFSQIISKGLRLLFRSPHTYRPWRFPETRYVPAFNFGSFMIFS